MWSIYAKCASVYRRAYFGFQALVPFTTVATPDVSDTSCVKKVCEPVLDRIVPDVDLGTPLLPFTSLSSTLARSTCVVLFLVFVSGRAVFICPLWVSGSTLVFVSGRTVCFYPLRVSGSTLVFVSGRTVCFHPLWASISTLVFVCISCPTGVSVCFSVFVSGRANFISYHPV